MMRHKMQRQQTPPRQKASEDIFAVLNTPFFFCQKKIIIATLELKLTLKGLALMGNDAIELPR
jgi:hypothetical protein